MKRAMIVCLILTVLVFAGAPKPGSGPIVEPAPIEVKPLLVRPFTWSMYGKVIAYYYHVRMPDGTTQQLKIKPQAGKLAPTVADWQTLADKQWLASKPDPNNVPKPCPYCGGTGVEP